MNLAYQTARHVAQHMAQWPQSNRAGILEFDAGIPRATAEIMAAQQTKAALHDAEVRSVVRMYSEQGKKAVVAFLGKVEEHRGKDARDRLEADALKALGAIE